MTVFGIRQTAKELLEIDHYKSQQPETQGQSRGIAEKGTGRTLDLDEGPIDEDYVNRHDATLASVENIGQSEHEEPEESEHRSGSKWLRINLVLCTITVWCMFVAGPIELAFATLMQDDIKNDETDSGYYRYECTQSYVYGWGLGENYKSYLDKKCGLLLAWTYVMQVAGSFSLVRTLLQGLPIYRQNYWTVHYREGGCFDRFITPARAFAIRTFFSGSAFVLHIVSAIMLGISPVINDKEPAAFEYQIMFRICLGLVCLCTVGTGQQTFATGVAAWRLRSSRSMRIWQI